MARELAAKIQSERKRGSDVVAEHKSAKQRRNLAAKERAANLFGDAASDFIREHKTKRGHSRPRRWRDTASLLGLKWERGVEPTKAEPELVKGGLADKWRDKPLATIDGHDIHTVVAEATKQNESRGRKLHGALSGMFGWLLHKRRAAANPTKGVWRPGLPRARERVLTDAEIPLFWEATDKIGQPFAPALKLLLLTGARRGEVAGMRKDELDDDRTRWTIPSSRTKNWRPNIVPLSPLARDILAEVPRVAGDYVFTTTGRSPISGWSKCKRGLDKAMGKDVKPWTLHDLRRTAASGMSRLGVRSEVIERALNHVSGSFRGVAGVYQRDTLSEEVKTALERWGQHVSGLVAGKSGKVVQLKKAKRA
jgi:integrase